MCSWDGDSLEQFALLFAFGDACRDFVDHATEIIDVIELVIFAGKANEGDLIDIDEVTEDHFADAKTGNFFFACTSQILFHGIEKGLDLWARDIALSNCGEDAMEEFFAAEPFAATIPFDNGNAGGLLDTLIGGESLAAGQAFAATADDGPAIGGAAVDYLVMVFFAKGALHGARAYNGQPRGVERRIRGASKPACLGNETCS